MIKKPAKSNINLKAFKAIKAFTILELVISMLLSLIVVLIAILAFEMISKQFMSYKKNNETIRNFYVLEGLLTNDFEFSKKIEWKDNNKMECYMPDNKMFSYQLNDTLIIRYAENSTDTFFVKLNKIDKVFLVNENSKIINELKLQTHLLNEDYLLSFKKNYAADCFDLVK
jgi:hypothetical protein